MAGCDWVAEPFGLGLGREGDRLAREQDRFHGEQPSADDRAAALLSVKRYR